MLFGAFALRAVEALRQSGHFLRQSGHLTLQIPQITKVIQTSLAQLFVLFVRIHMECLMHRQGAAGSSQLPLGHVCTSQSSIPLARALCDFGLQLLESSVDRYG